MVSQCKRNKEDEILVQVRSTKKPLRIDDARVPLAVSPFGAAYTTERRVRYGATLDDEQTRTIDLAGQVVSNAGMRLVVKDVSKENPVLRTLKRHSRRNMPCNALIILPCEKISSAADKAIWSGKLLLFCNWTARRS